MYVYLLIFLLTLVAWSPGHGNTFFLAEVFSHPAEWTMDTHIDFGGLELMQLFFPELTTNPTQLNNLSTQQMVLISYIPVILLAYKLK